MNRKRKRYGPGTDYLCCRSYKQIQKTKREKKQATCLDYTVYFSRLFSKSESESECTLAAPFDYTVYFSRLFSESESESESECTLAKIPLLGS
ncbi:hypothetical protein evm_011082 [Chilo suppressalis]|nr:hypothetical protein evm_011082 [Chilo suppressalis]